jgi:hypothetical protein
MGVRSAATVLGISVEEYEGPILWRKRHKKI